MRLFSKPLIVTVFVFAPCVLAAPATMPTTAPREHLDKLIAQARVRMRQDQQKYSKEQLHECENLYQVGNKNWRTPEAVSTLKVMIEKYPDVNRTGCAMLYLAQMSEGKERISRLHEAIDKFGDCWYGDGAQVGALARFYLGAELWAAGDQAAAQKLFDQLKADYPDAISHHGILLLNLVAQVQAAPPAATSTAPSTRP
jgi:hypothetical protein